MHDCPYCRCEPECPESHCLHQGAASYPMEVWFCCRCLHTELIEAITSGADDSSWPKPGCKLEIQVT